MQRTFGMMACMHIHKILGAKSECSSTITPLEFLALQCLSASSTKP